ncbi:MAG: 16S rRNA (uracil(1498)-N(3))-methyltransferase [Candidatus Latescibacteria bacterium]|jgi:16S rRNA (uracil1498-N3)-methyltransferase|nr:16S rRNA (uracil(1498)-N(3))-methyltransferase [Candidatus Latescibacterota bacterium]
MLTDKHDRGTNRSGYFYIPPVTIHDSHALMTDKDERRHLIRTHRKRVGDVIRFVDGDGWVYDGVIAEVGSDEIKIGITSRMQDATEPAIAVTLAPALLKGPRLDNVVEKVTELGVTCVQPVQTERTVVDAGGSDARTARWQRIASSAMKQSLRSRLTSVQSVMDFRTALVQVKEYDLSLIAWEKEIHTGLNWVTELPIRPESVLVFVGPEGGFETAEIEAAVAAGVQPVSMGKRRFRADTASIVVLTLLMAALGEMETDQQNSRSRINTKVCS